MKMLSDFGRHILMIVSIWATVVIVALISFGLLVEYGVVETEKVFVAWLIEDRFRLFITMFVFLFITVRIFFYDLFKSPESNKNRFK